MSLGAGIFLLAVGAVLAFAVNVQVGWVDVSVVGYILMAAGAVGIITGIVMLTHRRTTMTTSRSVVDPGTGERVSSHVSDSDDPLI